MRTGLDWQLLAQAGIFLAALLVGWLAGRLVQGGLNRSEVRHFESGAGHKLTWLPWLFCVLGSLAAPSVAYATGRLAQDWLARRQFPVYGLDWLLSFLPYVAGYLLIRALLQLRMAAEQAQSVQRYLLNPLLVVVLLIHGLGWMDELLAFSVQPGENPAITLRALLLGLLLLYLTVVAARLVRNHLRDHFLPRAGVSPALSQISSMLIFYALLTVGFLISLNVLGIDLTALTVILGGLSVGIGFGLQALFNNFVSGFILLMERTVVPGNLVRVADQLGTVKDVRLRSTLIRTVDDLDMVIPNGKVMDGVVINYSHGEPRRRVSVRASAALRSDARQVEQLLLQAMQHPLVVAEPAPEVYFSGWTPAALEFELYAYTGTPGQAQRVGSDIRYRIVELFEQHGIEMPLPPGDVRVEVHGTPLIQPGAQPEETQAD
jgi:small-conductance mechanosensitive channel